jgi:hypothetical protein
MDAHVGPVLVDRRPRAGIRAEAVADGVLHLERRELEAGERRAGCRKVDAQRPHRLEEAIPVDRFRELVQLVRAAIRAVRDLPQHAARDPRFEVDAIGELERSSATDTAVGGGDVRTALGVELGGKRALEPPRARDEEALAQRRSRRRVSTSAM